MQKKIPMRQCLGCREMKPKRELLRVVRSPEGEVAFDARGKLPGRGAYVCPNPDCFKKAVKTRALDRALEDYNARTGYDIPIHVDAASGGYILPFLDPDKKWDFRLKWVLSISTSGHKFGLVYPGLGWVVCKVKKYLPDEMSFSVNYLGANITQVGLNFSRPAAQILGQYYQFIRLGFEGYKEI